MVKWTDAKLKRQAIREWKESYECGHYPDWSDYVQYFSKEDWEDWADEYNMTVPEFKKYVDYFFEYNETRM